MINKNKTCLCGKPAVVRGMCNPCYQRQYNKSRKNGHRNAFTQDKINRAYETARLYYDIMSKVKQGKTYEEIGKEHGVTRQRIENIVTRLYVSYENRVNPS